MRKTLCLGFLLLAACGGTSEIDRAEELYLRVEYLRAALDTAYGDYNEIAMTSILTEMRRHATRDLEIFARDLSDPKSGRRRLAAFALGFAQDKKAQTALVNATKDQDVLVVADSLAALGLLGFEDTPIDTYKTHFRSRDWRVRQAALYGLRLQLKEGESRGMMTEVFRLLQEDPQMDVRNEAVIVLRRMRSQEIVFPLVRYALKDRHALVRQNACISLGSLGTTGTEATPYLIEALRDEDTKVVEAAWTALNRIHLKDFDRSYQTWRDWYEEEEKKVEYVCVDHPDVVMPIPGDCPKCRKKLLRQAKPEVYLCPVHPDFRLGKPGRCTTCRRALVAWRPEFMCPDHPETRSTRTGPCPVCQRDKLFVRETYVCPDHHDIEAPRPGKCSRCEKDLILQKE